MCRRCCPIVIRNVLNTDLSSSEVLVRLYSRDKLGGYGLYEAVLTHTARYSWFGKPHRLAAMEKCYRWHKPIKPRGSKQPLPDHDKRAHRTFRKPRPSRRSRLKQGHSHNRLKQSIFHGQYVAATLASSSKWRSLCYELLWNGAKSSLAFADSRCFYTLFEQLECLMHAMRSPKSWERKFI